MSFKRFYQDNIDKKNKKNRFNVSPVEERTLGGVVFASKKEMKRYAELQLLQRAGEVHIS